MIACIAYVGADPALIVAFPVILRSDAPDGAGLSSDPAWALVLLGFAALEHVNYFVWQLMHDTPSDMAFLRRHK